VYKISTDCFFVYSYGEETFDFWHPHFFDILFSYKKGLFLYTPLFLLSLIGLFPLWKNAKFAFYAWLGFFIFFTYLVSSWWCWYYGGSFSSRVYVEMIPLFMLILGIGLDYFRKKTTKIVLTTTIFLLIVLCQIQTYQYRYYIIHWADMTEEKYWDVFLKIEK
jgi:hypothetical protein